MKILDDNFDLKQGSAEETLFIPLYVKAKEFYHRTAIIKDMKSLEIMKQVEIDASRFDGGNITHVGILTRTQILDDAVNGFLDKHPNGIIINLGAGLDTRLTRIDNGKVRWYDLDLPTVIKLRGNFFEESNRVKFISKSVTDLSWATDIKAEENEPLLLIAEGLLMYFSEKQVKDIVTYIIDNFPNAEMYFDVVHSFFIGKSISSKFTWGIDKAREVTSLNTKIKLIEHWSIGDYNKKRQNLFLRIMNFLPSTKNRSQVIHVRFS